MPGITPSRYVRGIPNPHSAYASAEIPENVAIFKNLSRWRIRRRRRQYPVHNFVTVTIFVLMTLDTIRAYRHPTKTYCNISHKTARMLRRRNSYSRKSTQIHILASVANGRSLDLLLLKIITPFRSRNPPLFFDLSQSFLWEPSLLLWVVCDFLLRFTERT